MLISILVLWLIGGVLAQGAWIADFAYNYKLTTYRDEIASSIPVFICGLIAFFVMGCSTGFFQHGFCWSPKTFRKIQQAGQKARGRV